MHMEVRQGDCIQEAIEWVEHYPADKVIIAHITNNLGGWGRGFVLALSNKWKQPEQFYKERDQQGLGRTDLIPVQKNIFVANMCAQHGYAGPNERAVEYYYLRRCLEKLRTMAISMGDTNIFLPYLIGCGLGGGDEDTVAMIIDKVFADTSVPVYAFRLK